MRTGQKFHHQRKPTYVEAAQQKRIKEQTSRAKMILADEVGQAYYEAERWRLGKHNAYHTTIYDYFSGPEVLPVRL